jgi:hypothetical protein
MTIQPAEISYRAVRDYLNAFHLAAVYVTAPQGETPVGIGAGTERPADAVACWWTDGIEGAEAVIEMVLGCDLRSAAREGDLVAVTVGTATAAIEAAAQRLSIRLLDHEFVLARATGSVRGAELKEFQRVYRQRRLAGAAFPSYAAALRRLQAALTGTSPGTEFREVMLSVLQ